MTKIATSLPYVVSNDLTGLHVIMRYHKICIMKFIKVSDYVGKGVDHRANRWNPRRNI